MGRRNRGSKGERGNERKLAQGKVEKLSRNEEWLSRGSKGQLGKGNEGM